MLAAAEKLAPDRCTRHTRTAGYRATIQQKLPNVVSALEDLQASLQTMLLDSGMMATPFNSFLRDSKMSFDDFAR